MAGRGRIPLSLGDFDRIARRVPVLANIRPGGEYLMEDFYYAGGLRGLLSRLAGLGLLHTDRVIATGRTLGAELEGARVHNDDVIRRLLGHVHELQVTAGDTDLHPALLELRREIERRLGKRLLQASTER